MISHEVRSHLIKPQKLEKKKRRERESSIKQQDVATCKTYQRPLSSFNEVSTAQFVFPVNTLNYHLSHLKKKEQTLFDQEI